MFDFRKLQGKQALVWVKLTWDWKGSNICDGEGLGPPSSLNTLDQVNYM